jgi:hypothetical protein
MEPVRMQCTRKRCFKARCSSSLTAASDVQSHGDTGLQTSIPRNLGSLRVSKEAVKCGNDCPRTAAHPLICLVRHPLHPVLNTLQGCTLLDSDVARSAVEQHLQQATQCAAAPGTLVPCLSRIGYCLTCKVKAAYRYWQKLHHTVRTEPSILRLLVCNNAGLPGTLHRQELQV